MAEYDSPWKEAMEKYFPVFMAFFFPQAHADINWERGYNFLDKELEKVVRDAELGKRLVDKLVQVWRKNGEQEYILVHIEVQGQKKSDFPERMYVYNYRIYDRYRRKVASLAILADEQENWRPSEYGYELWGSRMGIRYPLVKLLDYRDRWSELESSQNLFAAVVMAQLKAIETAKDQTRRYQWKLKLVRRLYDQGYERQDVLELFRFIDWVLSLPKELEEKFWQELNSFEERRQMQYVTSVERIGIKKGIQQGLEQGLEQGIQKGRKEGEGNLLKRQLAHRFGELPNWVQGRLSKATTQDLECWAERILEASNLEEVFD